MTDKNTESLKDFQKLLVQKWQYFDHESMSAFNKAAGHFSSIKDDLIGLQSNLAEKSVKLAEEMRLSDRGLVDLNKDLVNLWKCFDTKVRTKVLDFREHISPELTNREMATAYDRATDKNCYDVPADKFKYQEHLPASRQSDSDRAASAKSDSATNQISTSLFITDPSIEKRIKDKNNRYKRNLVQPSVEFLTNEYKKLNDESKYVGRGSDIGNEEETKRLLAKLFIKLVRKPEVRKELWNKDHLKLIFGDATERILNAFSYPPSDIKNIKNFKECTEYLTEIFKESIISDFDFGKIRTEFLQEFLISLFHCYINPVYFNKELLLGISQELESKFGISWDALMEENTEYMRSNCPERNFGELYFLGQMSRELYYKVYDETDRELVRKIDDYSIRNFKLIGYPLVFELFNREFFNFIKCYDLGKELYENNSDDQVNSKKEVLFLSNIARQFKRHLVLSFIDTVTEMYKKDGMTAVILENDDQVSIEAGNHIERIRESINNIYPEDVFLYLQPRCRDIMEKKMKTEFLGKVFISGINSCIFKDDEYVTALKVIRNNQNYTLHMKGFKSYENALIYIRS